MKPYVRKFSESHTIPTQNQDSYDFDSLSVEGTPVADYLIAALWTSTDMDTSEPLDDNYSLSDFSEEAIEQAKKDWDTFTNGEAGEIIDSIGYDLSDAARDFWYSRNGHGTGFWDRTGEIPDKETRDKLQNLAQDFKEITVYVGDDGKLYFG